MVEALGRFDVLIGKAGIVHGTRVLDIAGDEYDLVLEVSLRGKLQMAQAIITADARVCVKTCVKNRNLGMAWPVAMAVE